MCIDSELLLGSELLLDSDLVLGLEMFLKNQKCFKKSEMFLKNQKCFFEIRNFLKTPLKHGNPMKYCSNILETSILKYP